jgi:hypothetical protein
MHARTSPTPSTRLWSITDIITERARTWLCPTTIYYSIKRETRDVREKRERYTREREEKDIQEREERDTRERGERDVQREKTGRHARQQRGKRKAFGSGPNGFFGVRAGSPVPASS